MQSSVSGTIVRAPPQLTERNMAQEDQILKALDKLEGKFDSLDARLDSVDKTLVKQEVNLNEHMRRTELAEKQISDIKTELAPIKRHVDMVHGALKLLGILSLAIGAANGIIHLLHR